MSNASALSARCAGTRVVLIHETADRTTLSELEVTQAAELIEQLCAAQAEALTALRGLTCAAIAEG